MSITVQAPDSSYTYTQDSAYRYAHDGNGNVMALVNAQQLVTSLGTNPAGRIDATYEYDPFGRPLRATGPYAQANPFRFSTKFTDEETGLVYYGYRYYDAVLGRWLSQEPIAEWGGVNLYGMCGNDVVQRVDPSGLKILSFGPSLEENHKKSLKAADENVPKYLDYALEYLERMYKLTSRVGGEKTDAEKEILRVVSLEWRTFWGKNYNIPTAADKSSLAAHFLIKTELKEKFTKMKKEAEEGYIACHGEAQILSLVVGKEAWAGAYVLEHPSKRSQKKGEPPPKIFFSKKPESQLVAGRTGFPSKIDDGNLPQLILHELAHLAFGARDIAYDYGNIIQLDQTNAMLNADNYAWFAHKAAFKLRPPQKP
jgi:RHS repeat-associated protein